MKYIKVFNKKESVNPRGVTGIADVPLKFFPVPDILSTLPGLI